MSKRKYQATKIQDVELPKLSAELGAGRVIVAIDVAKEDFYAAIVSEKGQVREIVKWLHPAESRAFLALVETLGGSERVEVAMEPSGVYGDAIRAALSGLGVPMFRISPKRVHDAAEVYDGVASLHDAKAATLIARLHLGGVTEPWPLEPEHRRRLAAVLRILEVHEKEARRNRNRLEGLLARHWPGATSIIGTDSATMLELLIEFGGPAGIIEREDDARVLMREVGGSFLAQSKIDRLIESAYENLGVPQLEAEQRRTRPATASPAAGSPANQPALAELFMNCVAPKAEDPRDPKPPMAPSHLSALRGETTPCSALAAACQLARSDRRKRRFRRSPAGPTRSCWCPRRSRSPEPCPARCLDQPSAGPRRHLPRHAVPTAASAEPRARGAHRRAG